MENLLTTLGIKQCLITKTKSIIALSVSAAIKQPYGVVHGGHQWRISRDRGLARRQC